MTIQHTGKSRPVASRRRALWSVALVYAVAIFAMAALPRHFAAMPDAFVAVVMRVEAYVPMIQRVTAYRYPYPEQLRATLALLWMLVPVLVLVNRGITRGGAPWDMESRSAWAAWGRNLLGLAIGVGTLFAIWYWPNLLFKAGEPLSRPVVWDDTRRGLFRTSAGVVSTAPLWVGTVVTTVDLLMEAVVRAKHAMARHLARR